MNLEDYQKQISNLSVNEQKLRDIYLRKLALGEIQGPPTGYPSLDRPWLKLHKEIPTKDLSGYKSIYDMIFKSNRLNDEAIGFLDGISSWSFKKLKTKTDKCISALKAAGVHEGDNILFGVTNTPEMIAATIAVVSLGAAAKFFDIRANSNEIINYSNSSNCKYMVCLDKVVLDKVKEVINQTNLEKVFVLRPENSLSTIEKLKYLYSNREQFIKGKNDKRIELPNDERFLELTDLIKKGQNKETKRVDYDENRPAIKVQSSGTTGKAKTIVHSEKSAIEFSRAISYGDLPLERGKSVLVALPPWIAYGLGDAIIMSLSLGAKVMLCADFEPNAVYRNIGNFTLSYAAPFHYRYLREHYNELSPEKKAFLRNHVDCMITGGDKYSALENEQDEVLFGTKVLNGYGNNEDWGALSFNPQHNNKYGTVGIPKYGEVVIVYDNDRNQELKYGEIGEICTISNTAFLGYENNEKATKKTIRQHSDGKNYLHTGDQGFIDEDGYINLLGRNERVIVRLGFKLSAYTIEDAISSLPYINECIAVEVPDDKEEHVPMVFVTISNDSNYTEEQIKHKINEDCKKLLKENEIPKYIKVVPKMKYTDNSKYDFRYYENIGKEFVNENTNSKRLSKKR